MKSQVWTVGESVRDVGTGPHCQSHLSQKGNALKGSDPLFQPDQIPAAENQEEQGRGVTEQNLIWPEHWPIAIAKRTRTRPADSQRWSR